MNVNVFLGSKSTLLCINIHYKCLQCVMSGDNTSELQGISFRPSSIK
jgi:hypothetical protein